MIRISSVSKRFARFAALDSVSLHVTPGESVALWGANGAGKSTLIRCVLGIFRFSGTITVGGIDVTKEGKQARSLIGYVPQELGFYDDLRVGEAISFFASLKGLAHTDSEAPLRSVDLVGHERKRVRELSGGMKQRLALAIALLGDPPVLVLDEVTASLDALGRDEFVSLLARLRHAGRTMLFASHRPEEIGALASRVVVLENGRVLRECRPASLAGPHALPAHALKIRLSPADAKLALDVFASRGLAAHLNGVGIVVGVDQGKKAAPMRLLVEANIPIVDFELLTSEQASRCTENHP